LVQEAAGSKESFILPVLHKLKLVCAHPYCVEPDLWLREHSPRAGAHFVDILTKE
jgi:hypothetical protein